MERHAGRKFQTLTNVERNVGKIEATQHDRQQRRKKLRSRKVILVSVTIGFFGLLMSTFDFSEKLSSFIKIVEEFYDKFCRTPIVKVEATKEGEPTCLVFTFSNLPNNLELDHIELKVIEDPILKTDNAFYLTSKQIPTAITNVIHLKASDLSKGAKINIPAELRSTRMKDARYLRAPISLTSKYLSAEIKVIPSFFSLDDREIEFSIIGDSSGSQEIPIKLVRDPVADWAAANSFPITNNCDGKVKAMPSMSGPIGQ